MTQKKVNLAILGAGMIGDVLIDAARKDGRADVSWIVTRTQKTLDAKLKKQGVPNGTLDFQDALADSNVDAVVIAGPPYTHTEMFTAALAAGKHVLLEKPMAIDRAEVQTIVDAADAHPELTIVECSCRHARLQPKFRKIKQMIDEGKLGEVYHIHHNHLTRGTFIEYNPLGTWALDKKMGGGGPFLDQGVYDLSFHLGLLSDVPNLKSIQSFTRGGLKVFKDPSISQNIEEHGAAYMTFDTGLTYYYERGSGVHCEQKNETRIYGTQGSIRVSFNTWDSPDIEYFYVDSERNEKRDVIATDMSEHTDDNQELMTHFLDCVLDGVKPLMTVNLAAKHLDILFRILGIE